MRISDWSSDVCSSDLQHQDLRTENGRRYGDTVDAMDFPYLARVTALNAALITELADAPPAPTEVGIDGALSSNTTVRWTPVDGAAAYRVHWRRADRSDWRSEEHTSELQSLMRISYAVFCLKKKKT